jgi:hypothetical protein
MKLRPALAAGLLMALSGCATYDYSGNAPGGYYRGSPEVRYRYPSDYYDRGYGYPFYGYPSYAYPYSWGGYGYPAYPVYPGARYNGPSSPRRRAPQGPPPSAPGNGQRPPPVASRPNPPSRPPSAPRQSRPEGRPATPWSRATLPVLVRQHCNADCQPTACTALKLNTSWQPAYRSCRHLTRLVTSRLYFDARRGAMDPPVPAPSGVGI